MTVVSTTSIVSNELNTNRESMYEDVSETR